MSSRILQHRRRVAVGVVGHQHQPGSSRPASTISPAASARVGQRLLHQHVLARRAAPPARSAGGCAPASRWRPRRRRRGRAPRRGTPRTSTPLRPPTTAAGPLDVQVADGDQVPVRRCRGSCGPGSGPSSPRPRRPLRAEICPCMSSPLHVGPVWEVLPTNGAVWTETTPGRGGRHRLDEVGEIHDGTAGDEQVAASAPPAAAGPGRRAAARSGGRAARCVVRRPPARRTGWDASTEPSPASPTGPATPTR